MASSISKPRAKALAEVEDLSAGEGFVFFFSPSSFGRKKSSENSLNEILALLQRARFGRVLARPQLD